MAWLIGIGGALGLGYLWLSGHWFGRVVAFIALLIVAAFFSEAFPPGSIQGVTFFLGAAVVAWFLAALPSSVARRRSEPFAVPEIGLEKPSTALRKSDGS